MTNPWTIGYEKFLEYLNSQISAWVDEKNKINERMRTRAESRKLQKQLEAARRRVTEIRREMKVRLTELERDWWEYIILRYGEASQRGDIGVYSALKSLKDRNRLLILKSIFSRCRKIGMREVLR